MGNETLNQVDLQTIQDNGSYCACCHRLIPKGCGVSFGRPFFFAPAVNVCRRCVNIAASVLGPEPTTVREGKS